MVFSPQLEEEEFFDYDPGEKQKLDDADEFFDFDPIQLEGRQPIQSNKNKLPSAPPTFTQYLGVIGEASRHLLSKNDKKRTAEIVKTRLNEGEDPQGILEDFDNQGWTDIEKHEIFSTIFPPEKKEKVETISVRDAFRSFDKRQLLKLTPKQLESMSPAEKEYFSEKILDLGEEEGYQAVLNGLTMGGADWLREKAGIEVPDFVDPRLRSVAEMVGSLPFYAFGNSLLIGPLMNYLKGGKVVSGIVSVLGNTGLVSTEQTVKKLIKEGDLPKLQEYTGYLADVAALEGILASIGKLNPFKTRLKKYAKEKGIPEEEALHTLMEEHQIKDVENNPSTAADEVMNALGEQKAENLSSASKSNVESAATEHNTELKFNIDKEGSASYRAPTENFPVNRNTPKSHGIVEPKYVDVPEKDIGKSASEIVGQHVQTGKPSWKFNLPNAKNVIKFLETKLYNRFAPLKDIGKGETNIMHQPRKLAELVKGYASTAESVLRYGQYDLETGLINGQAFEHIFSPNRLKKLTGKNKLDRVGFDQYLAARSSLERQAVGQKNPIPTQAAKDLIKEHPQYKELADDLTKFSRNDVKNLRKAGIVSERGAEAMFKMYENYAPLYRVIPEELTIAEHIKEGLTGNTSSDAASIVGGANSLRAKNPLYKARGSGRIILSPTESFVKNTVATQRAIAKNQAMKSIGRQLEKHGFEVHKPNPPKRTASELEDLLDHDIGEGVVEDLNESINALNPMLDAPKGSVRWYEDGKLLEVKGVPKDIIEAVEGLTPVQSNIVLDTIAKANTMFSAGVVLQPATMIKLGAMDLVVSTLQSKFPRFNGLLELPTRLLYEYPRMFLQVLKKGDLFQSYMQSGAAQSGLRGLDRQMLESMTDTFTHAMKRNDSLLLDTLSLPAKGANLALETLKRVSETLSDIPKLLEFERSLASGMKKGLSRPDAMKQAAFDAFEVSVPYGRKGSSQSLNFLYKVPIMGRFMNTIINSGVSFIKAMDPRNPVARSMYVGATAYLTIPTVMQYLRNRDDPRYQAIPQKEKDTNVYVYRTDDPDEEPLKFRKFWQFGWMFQTLPEHIVEFIIQKDPKALNGIFENLESEFSPFSAISISASLEGGKFDPSKLYESGRYSLLPERQKKIDIELQHTASTSQIARKLAKLVRISPIYIDHIVNQIGGGLGRDVLRIADEAIYQTGIEVDKRPAKQAADSIFYGTWWARGPSQRSEYANKFYEYVDKMETIKNTANALRNEGRDKEADDIMKGYVDVNEFRTHFSEFYKRIEDIRSEHPEDLDGIHKRKELNEIYRDMTELAKEYVEIIEQEMK